MTSQTSKPRLRQRLHRSRQERILFGVCGGLGEYFEVDPVLIRLAFVVTTLAGGAGVLAYVVLAIVLPSEETLGLEGRQVVRQNLKDLRADATAFVDGVETGIGARTTAAASAEDPAIDRTPHAPSAGVPPDVPDYAATGDDTTGAPVRARRNTQLAALVLIALGTLLMAANLGWFNWLRGDIVWPLILILVGIAILASQRRDG
jgi:phage shock protein C